MFPNLQVTQLLNQREISDIAKIQLQIPNYCLSFTPLKVLAVLKEFVPDDLWDPKWI